MVTNQTRFWLLLLNVGDGELSLNINYCSNLVGHVEVVCLYVCMFEYTYFFFECLKCFVALYNCWFWLLKEGGVPSLYYHQLVFIIIFLFFILNQKTVWKLSLTFLFFLNFERVLKIFRILVKIFWIFDLK